MVEEQLALRAAAYLRRGRTTQLIRVPPCGRWSRVWYLAMDGNFACEAATAALAVLEVGEQASGWKSNVEVPTFSPANAAHVRDVTALRAFDQALAMQVVWLGVELGFLARGQSGAVEHADPIEAILAAAAPPKNVVIDHRRR